jgi:hypothetical protein
MTLPGWLVFWKCLCCLALLSLGGCGQSETVPITGRVTLDGKDLPEGSIKFFYGDQLPGGVGNVQDGKFTLNCKPQGKMRVEITAVRDKTGVDPNSETTGAREQYLLAEYNLESKLTADVTREGEKHFVFPLLSKKK